jgi:TonB family protein
MENSTSKLIWLELFAFISLTHSSLVPQVNGGAPTRLSPGPGPVYRVASDVSAPVVIDFGAKPGYFRDAARVANQSGEVLVNLWVDTKGVPSHVHVVKGLGSELDEKAIEAVRQYRFKPGMKAGKPVIVEITIQLGLHP